MNMVNVQRAIECLELIRVEDRPFVMQSVLAVPNGTKQTMRALAAAMALLYPGGNIETFYMAQYVLPAQEVICQPIDTPPIKCVFHEATVDVPWDRIICRAECRRMN